MGSYSRGVRLLRTRDRLHSSGLISFGGQEFSKSLDILPMMLLEARSVPARVKT